MRQTIRRVAYMIYIQLRERPMASCMTFASVFVGVSALVLGERASRAFIEIGGGGLVVRLIGLFLATGGVLTTVGVIRSRTFPELVGLGLVSAGAFIYGVGVLFGLGRSGMIAGGLSLGLATGATLRVLMIVQAAKVLYVHNPED